MTQVVAVVFLVCAVAVHLTFTATRLDRLVARVETAWAALDAQLVRRAAAAADLAAHVRRHGLVDEAAARAVGTAAAAARGSDRESREQVENALSRVLAALLRDLPEPSPGSKTEVLRGELEDALTKVGFARQFYNDAVRDHRALRRRRVARVLARGKPAPPPYFEIDDTVLGDVWRSGRTPI